MRLYRTTLGAMQLKSCVNLTVTVAIAVVLFSGVKALAGPLSDRFNSLPPGEHPESLGNVTSSWRPAVSSVTLEHAGCAWGCRNYYVTIVSDGSIVFVGNPSEADINQFVQSASLDKSGEYLGTSDRGAIALLFQYLEQSGLHAVSAKYASTATDQYITFLSVNRTGSESLIFEYGRSGPIELQMAKNLIYQILRNGKYELSKREQPSTP